MRRTSRAEGTVTNQPAHGEAIAAWADKSSYRNDARQTVPDRSGPPMSAMPWTADCMPSISRRPSGSISRREIRLRSTCLC